jgi:nicotinamide riboside kinase
MATQLKQRTLVCITGPESSGKTMLVTQLGQLFAAPVAFEFSREWLHRRGGRYTQHSLPVIAAGQLANERKAIQQASDAPVTVADTDIQVLEVWWWVRFASPAWQRRYALRAPPRRLYPTWLQSALRRRTPRCYLLAVPDLAWEPDPLRESAGQRQQLFDHYRRVLQRDGLRFASVQGRGAARLQQALQGLKCLGYVED